jgi:hypothetical protein
VAVSQEANEQAGLLAELKETLQQRLAGSSGGNKIELNIAYGDELPEDTTKLWCKTSEPSVVKISPNPNLSNHEYESTLLPTTLPEALYGHRCCSVGNRIYIIGGTVGSSDQSNLRNTIYYYDLETKEVVKVGATLSQGVYDLSCAAIGSKIYIFGGSSLIDSSYIPRSSSFMAKSYHCFDTETNKITTLGSMPFHCLTNAGTAVVDGNIFLFGGAYRTYVNTLTVPKTTSLNAIYKYDGTSLTKLSSTLPSAVSNPTVYVKDGNIYVSISARKIVRFDPVAEAVYDDVNLNGNLVIDACLPVVFGDYLYGFTQGATYRENLNTFLKETVEQPRIDSVACANETLHDGKVYLIGGRTTASNGIRELDITIKPAEEIAGGLAVKCVTGATSLKNKFTAVRIGESDVQVRVDTVYKANSEGVFEKIEAALYKNGEWVSI